MKTGTGSPVPASPGRDGILPSPTFTVTGAEPARLAATPTLTFRVGIDYGTELDVRSVTLVTDIRISPARRRYRPEQEELLVELFGSPHRWATTLRPLPWTRVTTVVGPFAGRTDTDVPVTCSHDVDLAVTKYFHAVGEGEVPLDFLFSGTVFHTGDDGRLRTARISGTGETTYRMPAGLWHDAVRACSPGHSWLRLSGETYERLYAYRARHSLTGWDETLRRLLDHVDREDPPQP